MVKTNEIPWRGFFTRSVVLAFPIGIRCDFASTGVSKSEYIWPQRPSD